MESDYSDYSDDDDYLPISVGAWGDQSQQQQKQQSLGHDDDDDDNDTTSTHHDPAKIDTNGWTSMLDPKAKKMAGALGSGGLHRQGKNYKPISEELIINQRKGVVIPNSKKGTKKPRAFRSSSKQPTPPVSSSSSNNRKFSRNNNLTTSNTFSKPKTKKQPATSIQPAPPPALSTIRRPPPPSSDQSSGWGAQPLVDTPFWEKKNDIPPQPAPAPASTLRPAKTTKAQTTGADKNKNSSWGMQTTNTNTTPGFDSHQPTTTTMAFPPPGFGPVPQRQYPVKSNGKSQIRPPPGYAYAEKSAWGTPAPPQQTDNNVNPPPPQPWRSNENDKELWKKMDEGLKMNEGTTTNNESNGISNNKPNRDSGWGDLSLNQISPTNTENGGWGDLSLKQNSPTSTENGGWGDLSLKQNSPTSTENGGWGDLSLNQKSRNTENGGWDALPTTTTAYDSWGSSPITATDKNNNNGGWGTRTTTKTPTRTTSFDYDDHDSQHQTPMQFLDQQMAGYTGGGGGGRFSDPRKSKYSTVDHQNGARHLPKNYYARNGTSRPAFMEAPAKVAKPPPSHNPVVISIHLELDNGSKIPIPIRKLDSPEALAQSFCQSQNITNPALVNGIINLFAQQKSTAMQRYTRA